ncbi:FAD-dependent oxidoreductase [Mycobacterium sp. B14F4]|uniref:FAD-dependent oxidoreductase n=1 Tax=Mycobacterium sp. B14F4 TaxID=3153565 RepID=UPI00325F873A
MTEAITTPASCTRRRTVAVLGAGIAGLTAAHELAERGFEVTVYEPRADERRGLGDEPAQSYPPVKLGGLAASQYSTPGPYTGSLAELRPFPGRRGQPRHPGRAVAGEHGFRFFPAYYLHIWDLFQRIPVYQPSTEGDGAVRWLPTARTIMDNVRRVVTQGTTVEGKPSLVFPREAPRTLAEFLTTTAQLTQLGFTAADIGTFVSRLVQYLVTSPLRRASELQNLSAYDFFTGRNRPSDAQKFSYSPRFDALLREMPRVLAAFDTHWGDARTNLSTYLQLQLQMDRRDNKADGVLNGPTTESWFDHWYRHLVELGVRFVRGDITCLEPPVADPQQPPHLRPRAQVRLADGTRVTPDYTVVAVDAPAAERITAALRAAGTGGTVAQLDGFTTSAPPLDGPLQPATTRPLVRRDPYSMEDMGRVAWDRFQTLGGIQYYFDTEFQLLRGHMYYSGTEWALSSINQHGLWERRPILDRDGHVSVLSVDIGDFNTPSRHLKDQSGEGKAARDCTADEIATEVWRQIVTALTSSVANTAEALLPWPAWYAIDRGLILEGGPGQGAGRPIRNETPYLVPIVGDWDNRPGPDPWNPNGTSWTTKPSDQFWLEDLQQRNVFQARHGGYQVHHNSVVFAGTWTKTFTRMTSMEAACESGRHAVNAILDHYIWVESGGADRRAKTTIGWRSPYGFLDQGLTIPVRMPSPAGDYCYVVDMENREPLDTRPLRNLDAQYHQQSRPHPLDPSAGPPTGSIPPFVPPATGGPPMTSSFDFNRQLLVYLQAWRQLLEASAAMASAVPFAQSPPGMTAAPPVPPMPGMTPPGTSPPADYAQQLFTYLQTWRQHLEQAAGAAQGAAPGQDGYPSSPTQASGTGSGSPKPDPVLIDAPEDDFATRMDTGSGSTARDMLLREPERRYGSADQPSGTAFGAKLGRVPDDTMPPGIPRSLLSDRGPGTAGGMQTGQDSRRNAPEPTSTWWEAGRGRSPGAEDKPGPENILDVPPPQEWGGRQ